MSGNSNFSEPFDDPIDTCIFTTPTKGDFSELECCKASVRGRLKSHFSAWEEIGSPSSVLSVIKEGYKLPLLTIPESCVLANNKSATDNACFVTKALEDLTAANCISIVHSQPCVVNPLTVSVRAEGNKPLVLDFRHLNPHLFRYKFKCEDISTAQQLLGDITCIHLTSKVFIITLRFLTAIGPTLGFNGHTRANHPNLFLTYYHSFCLLHLTYSPKC